MQRSLHRFISLTAADLRKLRKEGRRHSQSRVLPIETDANTIDPLQEYTHALLGEVQMGLLDAVESRTEIFRHNAGCIEVPTTDNTPVISSEHTPNSSPIGSTMPSSYSTPNLSTYSSPNMSRRPSASLGGGRRSSQFRLPINNDSGTGTPTIHQSPFSSPNASGRNSLSPAGTDTIGSDILLIPSTERSSQSYSACSSPCPSPRSSVTRKPSLTRKPSMFFSQRSLECFLDNCTDVDSLNPIHHAAKGGHLSIVKHLAGDCQLDVNKTTKNGNTAIHLASEEGYIFVIEYLCNTHNAAMDSVNEEGWSPLHLACFWGHFLVVGYFVSRQKVDINRCNANASGHTPLILAVYSDHLSVVNTLVYHGVDLALSDSEEKSPFWWACCEKAAELIEDEETKTQVIFEMVEISMKSCLPIHTSVTKKTSVNEETSVDKDTAAGEADHDTVINKDTAYKNGEEVKA